MIRRVLLAALLLILPLAAQTPATPPAATRTAPPAGFTDAIVLWPGGAPLAHGTSEGDVPKLSSPIQPPAPARTPPSSSCPAEATPTS